MQHQQLAFFYCQHSLRLNREVLASNALSGLSPKAIAYCTKQTIYQVKHGLLKNLIQQLKKPDIVMTLA